MAAVCFHSIKLIAGGFGFLSEEVNLVIKEGALYFNVIKKSIDSTKAVSSLPGLTAQRPRPHRQV